MRSCIFVIEKMLLGRVDKEDIEIIYNDISSRYREGAFINASVAGVSKFISFYNIDARLLRKYNLNVGEGFIVVSNPPYGIRMTRHKVIPSLYNDVVREVVKLGCRKIIMITPAWMNMLTAFEANNIHLIRKYQIKHGQLDTFILYGVV